MSLIDQFTGNSVPLNEKIVSSLPFSITYSSPGENYTYKIDLDGGNFIHTLLTEYGSESSSIYANSDKIDRSVSIGDFELEDGFVSGSIAEQWSVRYRTNESGEWNYSDYRYDYGPKKGYALPPLVRNEYGGWTSNYAGFDDYIERGVLPDNEDEKYSNFFRNEESIDVANINPQVAKYFPDKWWENPWTLEDSIRKDLDNSNDGNENMVYSPEKFKKKFADKITNFNPSTDTLEIDTDSFSIDSSATFASGNNMKEVKKKLAKQHFDFLYDEKKGGLYFNENGTDKGFGDGGIIAILKGAPDLTSSNLELV